MNILKAFATGFGQGAGIGLGLAVIVTLGGYASGKALSAALRTAAEKVDPRRRGDGA